MSTQMISDYSKKLTNLLSKGQDANYTPEQLNSVIEILNFIRKECKKVDHLKGTDEAILIAGNTGNGKSTLLNYLKGEKLYLNDDKKLNCSNPNVRIGDGSGSTTLLPNFVHTSLGNFLDLAGDFETRGMIGEMFNNLWKSQLKLKRFKLVLVVPEDAFGPSGSYGKNFKEMIEKNSKFTGNLNHLKNNSVIVITFAKRDKKCMERVIKSLKNCMQHEDGSLKPYQQFLNFMIDNRRIVTFAEPAAEAKPGDFYTQPDYNRNQKEVILEEIKKVVFTNKEIKLEITSDPALREKLYRILKILKFSIIYEIQRQLKNMRTIHGIQLRKTLQILSTYGDSLLINLQNPDWTTQLYKNITKNQLFNIKNLNQELIENIRCVTQFLKTGNKQIIKQVQFLSNDGSAYLNKINEQIVNVLTTPGQNFQKSTKTPYLQVHPIHPQHQALTTLLHQLKQCYQSLSVLHQKKTNPSSQFYQDQPYKQLIRIQQQEYTQQEAYAHPVTLYQNVDYTQKEEYVDYENQVETYEVEEVYQDPVKKTRRKIKREYVTEQYEKPLQVKTAVTNFLSFGLVTIGKTLVTGNPYWTKQKTRQVLKQIPYNQQYTDYEPKTRKVQKQRILDSTIPVTKYKQIPQTKQIPYETTETRYREVIRLRERPVYEDQVRRKFLGEKYEEEVRQVQGEILGVREEIMGVIGEKNGVGGRKFGYVQEKLGVEDQEMPEQYVELLRKWEELEYCYYYKKYPNNELL